MKKIKDYIPEKTTFSLELDPNGERHSLQAIVDGRMIDFLYMFIEAMEKDESIYMLLKEVVSNYEKYTTHNNRGEIENKYGKQI